MHGVSAPTWLRVGLEASRDLPATIPAETPLLPGTEIAGLSWRKFSGATLLATLVDDADAKTAAAQPFQFLERRRSTSVLSTLGTSLADVRRETREREAKLGELWAAATPETKLLTYIYLGTEVIRAGQNMVGREHAESMETLGKLARAVDTLRINSAYAEERGREDSQLAGLLATATQKLQDQAPALIETAQLERLVLAAAEPFLIGKSEKRSVLDLRLEAATLEGSALVINEAQRAQKAGKLELEGWNQRFAGAIEKLPNAASPGGRALLALAADKNVVLDADTRKALHVALRKMGYYVQSEDRLTAAQVERAIAENITEPDLVFRDLLARAGSPAGPLTIGVMDGGFSTVHSALRDSLFVNEDELPDRGRDADGDGARGNVHGHNFSGGVPLDYVGYFGVEEGLIAHGTHVAGIATRGTDRIQSFLVTRAAAASELAAAIELAIAQGAKIINMSFSPWEADDVGAVRGCIERHPEVLFVKAAGNENREVGGEKLPQATEVGAKVLPNLLVVAASEEDGKKQKMSNFGPEFVAVAARGPQFSATTRQFSEELFVWTGATSQAAPFVTNTASKMKLLNPTLDPLSIKNILIATSTRDPEWSGLVEAGGLIDPTRAMQAAALSYLIEVKKLPPDAAATRLGIEQSAAAGLLAALMPR